MHLFVRTLCLVLFVAEHSVIPFMSLFFKYLGLSPLWSGIIRSCQSCLPVVCYLTISLIKNCNNFFPKRRTIIYLLIFINIGVHTCLIFIPPSASIDIMHCFEQFTDSDSKFHSEIGETREAVNYTAPSVNHFVSTNKSIPSELNQFKESHSHNDPSYGEYHTENSDKNYKINHNSENVNPLFKNGIIPITNSMASRYRQHDSKSIQKVRVPLNSAENSLNLMEKTTQKDYLINMNSHFGATTKPLTFQKVRNQAEIIRSHSPYDKSEEHRNNDEIISNGKHNLIIKGDEFLKNQALKKVETIFGSNHATLSKNYKGNLFTNHPNHAVSLMHTSSESTLSAIIENVKVKAAKQAQQSGDLPGENAFQKASNKALYDVDKLYGPADNFLPTSTEKVKLRYGKVYEQLVGLTTENTFYTDTKNDQLNLLNKIFLNAFFKNKKQSFRPFDISRKPKKILKINAVLHTTPISVEQDTSIEKGINYFRGRRSATENAEVSKDAFKYIKSSENMSSTVHLQTFEETVGGSHDVILKDKFAPNTTFSNLYVTFTFSLTLEFLNFICFLLIENMYSLNIMNVLFSHHISFPIWALIVCPILIIGSLLCPCPFQIATHFIVAIAILLIGMLLLICVPVGVLEIYTARKRKNSKPTYKSDNSYHFHYRIFSSLVVAAIGFLTACNSEFIMWHLHTDSTFSNNYEFLYCGYVMTSFLIHFITIRMWKQYKLVGEVEKEDDDDSEEWEPQSYELKDVEQSCSHWPRLAGLVSLATQMLLLPFLRPVWLLTLVAGILQGLTESFVLSRKYPYKAGYAAGCFVAGFVVQVHGTRILFLSAAAVTLVFILILLVSNRLSRFFCSQRHLSKLSVIPNYDSEETEDTKTEAWLERALQEEQYSKAKLHQNSSRLQQSVPKTRAPETTEDWLERAMQDEEYFKAKLQQSCKLKKSVSFN